MVPLHPELAKVLRRSGKGRASKRSTAVLRAGLRRFMISAARSSGARGDVLERITHNAQGAIIDVYTAREWSALREAVRCLKNASPGAGRINFTASFGPGSDRRTMRLMTLLSWRRKLPVL